MRDAIREMGSLQQRGVRTIVDLTPINLGRDIRVIRGQSYPCKPIIASQ